HVFLGVRLLLAQLLERGQTGDEDRRLADDRAVEFLGRAIDANIDQGIAEDAGRLVEESAGGGEGVVQVRAHADGLGALAGEKESARHDGSVWRARGAIRPRWYNRG